MDYSTRHHEKKSMRAKVYCVFDIGKNAYVGNDAYNIDDAQLVLLFQLAGQN